jgi:hypothetical protein
MRVCTYYFSLEKDKTSIKMSDAFWELSYITQLDILQDIASDADKIYHDHLERSGTEDEGKKYKPQIDLESYFEKP